MPPRRRVAAPGIRLPALSPRARAASVPSSSSSPSVSSTSTPVSSTSTSTSAGASRSASGSAPDGLSSASPKTARSSARDARATQVAVHSPRRRHQAATSSSPASSSSRASASFPSPPTLSLHSPGKRRSSKPAADSVVFTAPSSLAGRVRPPPSEKKVALAAQRLVVAHGVAADDRAVAVEALTDGDDVDAAQTDTAPADGALPMDAQARPAASGDVPGGTMGAGALQAAESALLPSGSCTQGAHTADPTDEAGSNSVTTESEETKAGNTAEGSQANHPVCGTTARSAPPTVTSAAPSTGQIASPVAPLPSTHAIAQPAVTTSSGALRSVHARKSPTAEMRRASAAPCAPSRTTTAAGQRRSSAPAPAHAHTTPATAATATGTPAMTTAAAADGEPRVLRGHESGVACLAVLAGGRLATGGEDKRVRVWDAAGAACVRVLEGFEESVAALTPWPGRPDLLVAASDRALSLWDVVRGTCLCSIQVRLKPKRQGKTGRRSEQGGSIQRATESYLSLVVLVAEVGRLRQDFGDGV